MNEHPLEWYDAPMKMKVTCECEALKIRNLNAHINASTLTPHVNRALALSRMLYYFDFIEKQPTRLPKRHIPI